MPINGRNFLQLAQLEPGVQIQDGAVFDPTKNGFASISFGGRYGRTARIEVDGGDISDENVGTTTMNIPASAIQEFQIEQSSLDLSSGMTSSGAVNISTRSGSNAFHGEGFDYGRWHNVAARVAPEDLFFRREQFGANFGGAHQERQSSSSLPTGSARGRTMRRLSNSVDPSRPLQFDQSAFQGTRCVWPLGLAGD